MCVETASSVHVETVGAAMSVSSGQTVLPEPAPGPAEQQVALTKDLGPAVQLDAATDLATSAGQHSQNEQERSSSASLAQSSISIPAQVPPQKPAPPQTPAPLPPFLLHSLPRTVSMNVADEVFDPERMLDEAADETDSDEGQSVFRSKALSVAAPM